METTWHYIMTLKLYMVKTYMLFQDTRNCVLLVFTHFQYYKSICFNTTSLIISNQIKRNKI